MGRLPASRSQIRLAAESALRSERVSSALLSIAFVGEAAITTLNRSYLRRRGPTDVISFRLRNHSGGDGIVGDIYICPAVARMNARRQGVGVGVGVSAREELLRLVVHGVLHVTGLDHPEGAGRTSSAMWRKQERILGRII